MLIASFPAVVIGVLHNMNSSDWTLFQSSADISSVLLSKLSNESSWRSHIFLNAQDRRSRWDAFIHAQGPTITLLNCSAQNSSLKLLSFKIRSQSALIFKWSMSLLSNRWRVNFSLVATDGKRHKYCRCRRCYIPVDLGFRTSQIYFKPMIIFVPFILTQVIQCDPGASHEGGRRHSYRRKSGRLRCQGSEGIQSASTSETGVWSTQ